MTTVIANPIINSPYRAPARHFEFANDGITDTVVESRRRSSYFIPIPAAKKKGARQLEFGTEWTLDRIKENEFINRIRDRVGAWREAGYQGVTTTTRKLLHYWTDPDREKKLFFCQIEALETAIFLAEAARRQGDTWIESDLRGFNEDANPELFRIAFKMATGSGKTVVMAMLIAWQALNKLANPQDARFSDTFLVVTPGITIRDRLRVLMPNDPENYYRQRDVLPPEWLEELGAARIVITNFHAFKRRDRAEGSALTKRILAQGQESPFLETPDQMVRRVCREFGNKKNIVVLNDEAHHCYRRRQGDQAETLAGEERREVEKRDEEARIWISGLEAVKRKLGVRVVYDLSATPFFLRGSGEREGLLFPWVVSDFALIDAIESGVVKIPRVPIADDAGIGELPSYRDLWAHIRDQLPRKGRGTEAVHETDRLPAMLEGALLSLYDNYRKSYDLWRNSSEAQKAGMTPPVFIVVCNNTNVSKLVFDWIAGTAVVVGDGDDRREVLRPGRLEIFSNVIDGRWAARPSTILVDSEQLESDDAMTTDFKKLVAKEIEEFKDDYRARFPGRSADDLDDKDILREVMNTVGKPGKLGEGVKCVVSVSMLTEGWDANTVTHILGVRAFGTQLLCEQVVGRGLRRRSYAADDNGMLEPEYAEVYGVPFSFIPTPGSPKEPKPGRVPTHIRALPDRADREITFPRVIGYRYDMPSDHLKATFAETSAVVLSSADVPTSTEVSGIVGEREIHTLDELKAQREQAIVFEIAKETLERFYRDDDGNLRPWLFPQLVAITREWLSAWVRCKDNTYPQLLLLSENKHRAAEKIRHAIDAGTSGHRTLKPILRPYDHLGSTRFIDFETVKDTYQTNPSYCHVSHVASDSGWEIVMAQRLEEMARVVAYVKNQGAGFYIPYTVNGEERNYLPDFIARIDDGHGAADLLNLVIEVTGQPEKDKEAKVTTAKTLWIPAINNHGGFGRWAFLEVKDPWDAKNLIRAKIDGARV